MQVCQSLPLVTIGMTSYMHEKYLEQALDSVLQQSYTNIQIILSVDKCEDRTADIAKEYAVKFKDKIELQLHEVQLGASGNANSILPLIKGDLFCWFACDDIMHPEKLEKQVSVFLKEPHIAACYHDMQLFDDGTGQQLNKFNKDYRQHYPLQGDIFKELISRGCFVGANSYMVRTDILKNISFPKEIERTSDWLLMIEIAQQGEFRYIDECLLEYRIHTSNLSRDCDVSYEEAAYIWLLENKNQFSNEINKGLIRLKVSYFFHYLWRKDIGKAFRSLKSALAKIKTFSDLRYGGEIFLGILLQKISLIFK